MLRKLEPIEHTIVEICIDNGMELTDGSVTMLPLRIPGYPGASPNRNCNFLLMFRVVVAIVFQQCLNTGGQKIINLEGVVALLHQPCRGGVFEGVRRDASQINPPHSIVESGLDVSGGGTLPLNHMTDVHAFCPLPERGAVRGERAQNAGL